MRFSPAHCVIAYLICAVGCDAGKGPAPPPLPPLPPPSVGPLQRVVIKGGVYDIEGKPVSAASVAREWSMFDLKPQEGVTSDGDGKFRIEANVSDRAPGPQITLFAMDPERRRGGIVDLVWDEVAKPATIKLFPLVTVRVEFDSSTVPPDAKNQPEFDLGPGPGLKPGFARWSWRAWENAHWRLRLPPGEYCLLITGTRHMARHDFVVPIAKDEVNLGRLDLGVILPERRPQ